MKASNRVIANTGVQYAKAFISIIITLYTSRIVLNNLGVSDFGIYSLVGGVITMLSFIQSNLSLTYVRFLSYYRGNNNEKKIIEIFNNSISTQLLMAIVLVGVLISLTNPVFNHFLNIQPERIPEAKVVYFLMLGSLFFNFMSVPFMANLISRENITYSSLVQILDAILKVPIAVSLIWISENKLEWYSTWMMLIIVINFLLYFGFCYKKYPECRHFTIKKFNIPLFKEMFSFMGWNVYGTMCIVARQQGIAILLNRFYTTAINAAYGIAFQVSAQLSFVSNSLTQAINPQIIKAEGSGNRTKMFRLAEISCKFSFLLMSIISIPAFLYMPTLLELWLKNVPEQTTMFCRCVLLAIQIDLLSMNLAIVNQAIGNVRLYQISQQTIKIITLPFAWLALHFGYDAFIVMMIYVLFELICAISRVVFLHINIKLPIRSYLNNVLFSIALPFTINLISCFFLYHIFQGWTMLITFSLSCFITLLSVYLVGLNKDEKEIIKQLLSKIKK